MRAIADLLRLLIATFFAFTCAFGKSVDPNRLRAEGDVAFTSRDYSSALKYYTQLIKVEPKEPKNWHKRAMVHLIQTDLYKAISDWSKAIKLDPKFTSALIYRAKCHRKLGDCVKSKSDYAEAQSLGGGGKDGEIQSGLADSSECIELQGQILTRLEQGDCSDVDTVASRLLEITPLSKRLNLGMADCAVMQGDLQAALKFTGNILRALSQDLDTLLFRGQIYYKLGEHDMALKHYKSGLRSDPEHKPLKKAFKHLKKMSKVYDRAQESHRTRKFDDAFEDWELLIGMDDEWHSLRPTFFYERCRTANRMRKLELEKKLEYCNAALEQDDGAHVQYQLGKAYESDNDWEKATRHYQNAVNKDQGNRDYQEALRNSKFEEKKARRKDYYKILGVEQSAHPRQLKKAFRKCGLEHHPDKVKHLPEGERKQHEDQFKECVEAHDILSDAELRAKYDRGEDVLEQMQNSGGGGGPFGGGFPFNFGQGGGGGGFSFTFQM